MNFDWLSNNFIEIFGAITGILYVILEIRQNILLWPIGVITSAVYIWVFFTGKFYADMSLQGYYLVISFMGWYWWLKGNGRRAKGAGQRAEGEGQRAEEGKETKGRRDEGTKGLSVTRVKLKTALVLALVFLALYFVMWFVLDRFTDSPVPVGDSFITSLSIVATWMLARKIFEHWFLWIVVNAFSVVLFVIKGLYPTVILYIVYCAMSFAGLIAWKRSLYPKTM
jgi:nicotinamide mononucleotide transporter